jgi:hypothetical protein
LASVLQFAPGDGTNEAKGADEQVALLFPDVDRFKEITICFRSSDGRRIPEDIRDKIAAIKRMLVPS